jgi:hypothetical protein
LSISVSRVAGSKTLSVNFLQLGDQRVSVLTADLTDLSTLGLLMPISAVPTSAASSKAELATQPSHCPEFSNRTDICLCYALIKDGEQYGGSAPIEFHHCHCDLRCLQGPFRATNRSGGSEANCKVHRRDANRCRAGNRAGEQGLKMVRTQVVPRKAASWCQAYLGREPCR